jgi:hypothetical protein
MREMQHFTISVGFLTQVRVYALYIPTGGVPRQRRADCAYQNCAVADIVRLIVRTGAFAMVGKCADFKPDGSMEGVTPNGRTIETIEMRGGNAGSFPAAVSG